MTGRPFAAVDNSYDDYKLPILSKPVAHNIQIITDYEAVKNLLQAGVLRWRDGEMAKYIAPLWVSQGCFGVLRED